MANSDEVARGNCDAKEWTYEPTMTTGLTKHLSNIWYIIMHLHERHDNFFILSPISVCHIQYVYLTLCVS